MEPKNSPQRDLRFAQLYSFQSVLSHSKYDATELWSHSDRQHVQKAQDLMSRSARPIFSSLYSKSAAEFCDTNLNQCQPAWEPRMFSVCIAEMVTVLVIIYDHSSHHCWLPSSWGRRKKRSTGNTFSYVLPNWSELITLRLSYFLIICKIFDKHEL